MLHSEPEINDLEVMAIFRMALEKSIIEQKSVVEWSDKIISSNPENVPDFALELSISGNYGVNEAVHLLRENESTLENPVLWKILYGLVGLFYREKQIELSRACNAIADFANEIMSKTEYDLFGMSVSDAYFLAENGSYGNLENVEKSLLELTEEQLHLGKWFRSKYLMQKNEA
ncbi:hypothetical protein K6119_07995 [Paracrocinitomix mangrovi]|uniref:hypothetical protein n=1 Tax=Paracrocinitomix mangrovi TaxID=2862509 RepID=UPI001EDA4D54|nr:hypothetical protein [Paracrocinitomix mangrovi]UKN00192.1 hypothetical protein K6119_10655 [Paracrocinitomix mangrovi]UKN03441.1 hypothetical protein K6119_07935 [Paracrocinitomix mangrovi]UKN03453.1 hypothetical protein K6119_07995 [Paracrocinitomix mangrovi]